MAAGGYPNEYAKGHVISGLPEDDDEGSKVFHAGTRIDGADVVTSGGRVLCVVGLGESLLDAKHKAYEIVAGITWVDEFHRNDIGQRAVARE